MHSYFHLMRLDKPIGIFLLLWPTLWALFLASHGLPSIEHLTIFVLGTVLMRSAGCVANDILDRKFDSFVTRTKLRPLANQSISVKNAFFLLIILLLGALICVLFLNEQSFYFSLIALFLALTYPLTKRFFVMLDVSLESLGRNSSPRGSSARATSKEIVLHLGKVKDNLRA